MMIVCLFVRQDFKLITRKRLQLVGVTAMFIASKYEEMYSPDISDFVYITDNAYTKAEILQMEMLMIKTLQFSFGRPLPLHFLRRYSKAGKVRDFSATRIIARTFACILGVIHVLTFVLAFRHCRFIIRWQSTSWSSAWFITRSAITNPA